MPVKTGRNEPCPCGSGKKYKRCCWQRDHSVTSEIPTRRSQLDGLREMFGEIAKSMDEHDDRLMALTNGVLEFVQEKRLDEAERMCERLRDEFPDDVDWLDRSAIIAEARGDLPAAIDFYRRAADFAAEQDSHEEVIEHYRERAAELEATLARHQETMP